MSVSSKPKAASATRKTSSKFKVLPAISSSIPKIIINIRNPVAKRGGERGEGQSVEEEEEVEETVVYLFLTEGDETKIERKLSERMSPRRKKKSGVFMTQDEGKRLNICCCCCCCC